MALPPLDDSGVQEGVITSKKKRDDTVQQLNEFDYSQALSLNPVEQDIQTMNIWLTDIEGMFQSGLTDVHFQSSHWGILASRNTLKMELEARTSRIPGDTAVQPNNYDLTTMFSTFLSGASPIQFGYAGFIRKPTVLYGPSILGFASLPTHSTTKNINENVKDESNELDEIYAAILKSNPELAVDNPSTPQTYSANEPITYEGMRKVLGGNGSGTPDGLFAMGVGLSIAAKKGGEIAADEFLLNDIETLRDPNASKTDKGIALFSLTPMGKLKKAAEGIEEGKDLLEHVIEAQKKAEKAKETAKDANKSVGDVEVKDKANLGDAMLKSNSAQAWGILTDGTNQGVKHFNNYWELYPERIPSLANRLGVDPNDFENTVRGFENFTNSAKNIMSDYTSMRTVGDKTMYFVEGTEKAKKGVAVIVQNGKIQTMMPTSPKDFLKLQ
ncbi:MAG: T7SS effector LXG polymorphic toxin [Psychrobacillus psychrodurans]